MEGSNLPELTLDDNEQFSFVRYYNRLIANEKVEMEECDRKSTETSLLHFFDRKGFYTCHGADALFIADSFYKTQAVIKMLGSATDRLPSIAISLTMFENIIRSCFIDYCCKVVVMEGEKVSWNVGKKGSPGNLRDFEDIVSGGGIASAIGASPITVALRVDASVANSIKGARNVGVTYCDITCRRLGLCQIVDDEAFSTLESLLVQITARECLIGNDTPLYVLTRLREVLSRIGCAVTLLKKTEFQRPFTDVENDVARLSSSSNTKMLNLNEIKLGTHACGAIVKNLGLCMDEANCGHYRISLVDTGAFMRLDAAAIRALNVMPPKSDVLNITQCPQSQSLFGLLNRCRTAMGSRRLLQWLKQPLTSVAAITKRQDMVTSFVNDSNLRQLVIEQLRRIPDLDKLANRFFAAAAQTTNARASGRAGLRDCIALYHCILAMTRMSSLFNESSDMCLIEAFGGPITLAVSECQGLLELVDRSIDMTTALIRSDFTPELQSIAKEQEIIKSKFDSLHADMQYSCQSKGVKKIIFENNSQHGYYFRVTRNEEKALRATGVHYEELATNKDGMKFTTKELKRLSDTYHRLESTYEKEQQALACKCVEVVATYLPLLEKMMDVLAELDVLISFAIVAESAPKQYVRPELTDLGVGDIILEQCRHPCLEIIEGCNGAANDFIANDISLERDKSWFQIITGPNMGGKSTYIRQAGVIILMAQIGSFVPCSRAKISIVDCILARVGAGDSQSRGVSTFMAEMLETSFILRSASCNSLIIIDELGRGTSTYDGFGLAWAISENIATKLKAPCLFATHFHELTAMADVTPSVANRHVTAHVDERGGNLTMLYKVRSGPCDQSFGIHVAEMVHFPKQVINMAKRKAMVLESFEKVDYIKRIKEIIGDTNDDSINDDTVKKLQTIKSELEGF